MKKIIIAFAAGQGLQLLVHTVALNIYAYQQVAFCAAAGVLVLVAMIAGAWGSLWEKTGDIDEVQELPKEITVSNDGVKKVADAVARQSERWGTALK